MLNMIKMDIYRMLRTKAMYIVWLFMIVAIVSSSALLKEEYTDEALQQEYEETAEPSENVNLGMSVTLPTGQGARVSLYDLSFANIQGKFFALFVVIFAVIFSTSDLNSGYIKNYGGQVRHRWMLVLSKGIALAVYTALTMILFLTVQGISNLIYFGYFELGPTGAFFRYIGAELALHWALALIVMTLAILIRSNAFSMVLAICLCMNMMMICYSVLDKWIAKAGVKDFQLLNYTVTGKISMLAMDLTVANMLSALLVGAGFIVGASAIGSYIFQKRDIQ